MGGKSSRPFAVRDLGYEIEKAGADPDQILTSLQHIGVGGEF